MKEMPCNYPQILEKAKEVIREIQEDGFEDDDLYFIAKIIIVCLE